MPLDNDKALFKALNIIDKLASDPNGHLFPESKKLDSPVNVEFFENFLIYNGSKIKYPDGYQYNKDDGFTINGEKNRFIFLNTYKYIYATNSFGFMYYLDLESDNLDAAEKAIDECFCNMFKLFINNRNATLVCGPSAGDIMIMDAEYYKPEHDGDLILSSVESLTALVAIFTSVVSMRFVHDFVNGTINNNLKGISDSEAIEFSLKEFEALNNKINTLRFYAITSIIGEDIRQIVIDTVTTAVINLCN